jgi:hypothetical protein
MLEREGSAGGGLTPATKPMRKTFAACCAHAGTLNSKSAALRTTKEIFLTLVFYQLPDRVMRATGA